MADNDGNNDKDGVTTQSQAGKRGGAGNDATSSDLDKG